MTKTPRNESTTEKSPSHPDPLFLGADAPPLEGEALCICGELEGAHQVDGACPSSGCLFFVEDDGVEETTRPDLVVEYDAGVSPLGRAG